MLGSSRRNKSSADSKWKKKIKREGKKTRVFLGSSSFKPFGAPPPFMCQPYPTPQKKLVLVGMINILPLFSQKWLKTMGYILMIKPQHPSVWKDEETAFCFETLEPPHFLFLFTKPRKKNATKKRKKGNGSVEYKEQTTLLAQNFAERFHVWSKVSWRHSSSQPLHRREKERWNKVNEGKNPTWKNTKAKIRKYTKKSMTKAWKTKVEATFACCTLFTAKVMESEKKVKKHYGNKDRWR